MSSRRHRPLAATAALLLAAGLAPAAAHAQTATVVGAFPAPGTPTASPKTQISLRGITAATAGTITVTGSTTGAHSGRLECWSDAKGCSYVLDRPFDAAGETVSVATDLPIAGASDGDYSFTVVGYPAAGITTDVSKIPPALLTALTGQVGTVKQGDPTYRSAPDLKPPKLSIFSKVSDKLAPGYLFTAPKLIFGAERPAVQSGPLMSDNTGQPVWFKPDSDPGDPLAGDDTDFRVQNYKGHPVLTYWRGKGVLGVGQSGQFKMLDEHYQTIATVTAGNGYGFDLHEARLTPQGTLLALVYNPVTTDLSSVGGSPDARAIDTIVQEIDIKTGLVEFEFHSMGNIALTEGPPQQPGSDVLDDYVHGNSVSELTNGNLLLSGRSTSALYQLDHTTGQILSRYGGKLSDYTFTTPDARFSFQHDVVPQADGTLTLFDNHGAPFADGTQSRGLVLSVDDANRTLSLVHAFPHPSPPLQAGSQGSVQPLPNGNYLVEYGAQGFFTEFTAAGQSVLDGYIARGQDTYRAYRYPWVGKPTTRPAVTLFEHQVYVSWNGATQVVRWRVQSGPTATGPKTLETRAKHGFETHFKLSSKTGRFFRVQALSRTGQVLGSSRLIRTKG